MQTGKRRKDRKEVSEGFDEDLAQAAGDAEVSVSLSV